MYFTVDRCERLWRAACEARERSWRVEVIHPRQFQARGVQSGLPQP